MLRTEQDFYDLAAAYLRRAAADGARHVEMFFDPQSHIARGVPFAEVVGGIARRFARRAQLGVTSRLIMCFLRDAPADAIDILERRGPAATGSSAWAGLGRDRSSAGEFARVFARARAAGFVAVAHAGEEGPPQYMREALDVLKVRRMDHGVAAIDDVGLHARLAGGQ